jgi:formylglycine-generating enzyme required for sulfatase activity
MGVIIAAESAKNTPVADGVIYSEWPFTSVEARRRQEETAKRLGIPVERTLDLGNDVKLELVLIPAGKFNMGMPLPESPWVGGGILLILGLTVLVLVAVAIIRAIRQHRRFQFSWRWLILLVVVFGGAQYGGFRCWQNAKMRSALSQEVPMHEVTMHRPYYVSKFEVTQEQYTSAMGVNPSCWNAKRRPVGMRPVEMVSWDDAKDFCRRVSSKVGRAVRLPTETEWEYACRAGVSSRYYSGDDKADLDRIAWFSGNCPDGATRPVGQKEANAFGLHDMSGNVAELCEDDWHESYNGAPGSESPWIDSPRGENRVLRGGFQNLSAWHCRSTFRHGIPPDRIGHGFRVVAEITDEVPSSPPPAPNNP